MGSLLIAGGHEMIDLRSLAFRELVSTVALFVVTGCSMRGIPSHGGGLRFDVEQQLFASSVQNTVAGFDLSPLAGKTVALRVASVGTSAVGVYNPGGLDTFVFAAGDVARDWLTQKPITDGAQLTGYGYRGSGTATLTSRSSVVSGDRFPNREDMQFLGACIAKAVTHAGGVLTEDPDAAADVELHALFEVAGSNRYRREFILWATENLDVNCQVNLLGVATDSGEVLLPERTLTSGSSYGQLFLLTLGPFHEWKRFTPGISAIEGEVTHSVVTRTLSHG